MILGIAILNKAGGVYGILSIITGHPLNFWQWLYNILAILTLPFYVSALINLKNKLRNTRKLSVACLVYVADTLVGLLYTLYFMYYWFSREDSNPTADPLNYRDNLEAVPSKSQDASVLASQSASPGRELFLTLSSTISVTVIRFYFTLVIISFTRGLLKQDLLNMKYEGVSTNDEEEQMLSSGEGFIAKYRRWMYDTEMRSKELLRSFFN